jgi:hypothetical protein
LTVISIANRLQSNMGLANNAPVVDGQAKNYWAYAQDATHIHVTQRWTDGAMEYIPSLSEPLPSNPPSGVPLRFDFYVQHSNLEISQFFSFAFRCGEPLHTVWSKNMVGVTYETLREAITCIQELVAKNYQFTMEVTLHSNTDKLQRHKI